MGSRRIINFQSAARAPHWSRRCRPKLGPGLYTHGPGRCSRARAFRRSPPPAIGLRFFERLPTPRELGDTRLPLSVWSCILVRVLYSFSILLADWTCRVSEVGVYRLKTYRLAKPGVRLEMPVSKVDLADKPQSLETKRTKLITRLPKHFGLSSCLSRSS